MPPDVDRSGNANPFAAAPPTAAADRDDIPGLLSRLREERTDHLVRIVTHSTAEADSHGRRR